MRPKTDRSKTNRHIPQPNPETAHLFADGLLTIPEAAAFLRVCRATIYNLMADGQLKWVSIGRCRRISKGILIEFAQQHAKGGENSPDRLSY